MSRTQRMRAQAGLLVVMGVLLTSPGRVGRAQQGHPPVMQPAEPNESGRENSALAARLAADRERAQATDRQKRIVSDTDRLYALATELKEQVGKSNKDTLSLDVIKKADEIEKLAHSVKEHMKG